MIGAGPELGEAKRVIDAAGFTEAVIFTGLVAQEEGPSYLAACDILVSPHVPNADGTPFFGSPTKLFEYMAMGRGIVASDLDQIGEVLRHGETAWLVPPGRRRCADRRDGPPGARSGVARRAGRGGAARGAGASHLARPRATDARRAGRTRPRRRRMTAKRLLAICWDMPPLSGPRAVQVSRSLKHLVPLGWESSVVCFGPRSSRYNQDADLAERLRTPDGVTLVPVPSLEERALFRALWRIVPPLKLLPDEKWVWIGAAARAARALHSPATLRCAGLVRAAVVRSSDRSSRPSGHRTAVDRPFQRSVDRQPVSARASLAAASLEPHGARRHPNGHRDRLRECRRPPIG